MHAEILTAEQRAVLDALKPLAAPAGFYLAGGTALALRHAHRRSVDFDFFRPDAFDGAKLLAELDDAFDRKFGSGRTERYHRLRALAYFDDAEREPMPDLLAPFDWAEAKRFFATEAARLLDAGITG